MTANFEDQDSAWREAERSWAIWLQVQRYTVTPLSEAVGNAAGTNAPMISTPTGLRRAPDLHTVRDGRSEYWEVKFRSRSDLDVATGVREHWMSRDAFVDYTHVAAASGSEIWVVLYEAPTTLKTGRWLKANVRRLRDLGHVGSKTGRSGEAVDSWVWPVTAMEVIEGPPVDLSRSQVPLLAPEGPEPKIGSAELELAERSRRQRRSPRSGVEPPPEREPETTGAASALARDVEIGRDLISDRLGLDGRPRYSVLRVGPLQEGTDDILELLHYGIRVFLVTNVPISTTMSEEEVDGFEAARLLERAVVPSLADEVHWVLDGVFPAPIPEGLSTALKAVDEAADESDTFNFRQYQIVHARHVENVLVTAGAGTGKTETMAERLLFLLATDEAIVDVGGEKRPSPLTADQVTLVTFTRESAKEMRARLARSLMLRQRMCRYCIYPARAWMMQLSNAEISTIHTFAKRLIQTAGGGIGFGPGFRVGEQTMEFRSILQQTLSPSLSDLLTSHNGRGVPPVHAWQRHLKSVWDSLESNGTTLMSLGVSDPRTELDWGSAASDGIGEDVCRITRDVLCGTAEKFADRCEQEQVVPASQLVALARSAIQALVTVPASAPKYLFVDEFQDTDALQMELLLDAHVFLGARLFVVGDAKQGIYRFRGAEGNAFKELALRTAGRGLAPFTLYSLTRNFRSGAALLDSLHPYFSAWGASSLLAYADQDRLRPVARGVDTSRSIELRPVPPRQDCAHWAAVQVGRWRAEDADDRIAILCRRNSQAENVQRQIHDLNGPCELLVGGRFYTTPAVREMRVLLEALIGPHDDAALLELCETRWAAKLLDGPPPPTLGADDADSWRQGAVRIVGWRDRLAHLAVDGTFGREDLDPLRDRVHLLRARLARTSVIGLVIDCIGWFTPEGTALPGDGDSNERRRYLRCLDHLVTLMDLQFASGAASIDGVLGWLRLQIHTNQTEDEPFDFDLVVGTGRTIALTVHKAKGLEFDRVVIPFTKTPFRASVDGRTTASVVRQSGSNPRILWEWTENRVTFANFLETDEVAQRDELETIREETRLLYVATTRARRELVVLTPTSGRAASIPPKKWADLLAAAGDA